MIDEALVLAVELPVVGAGGLLQLGDGVRVVQVALTARAPLVLTSELEVGLVLHVHVGRFVAHQHLALDGGQVDAADTRGGAGEELLDHLVGQAHGLEDLGADVGTDGADAHLGHGLEQALAHRLEVALASLVG